MAPQAVSKMTAEAEANQSFAAGRSSPAWALPALAIGAFGIGTTERCVGGNGHRRARADWLWLHDR